MSRQLRSLLSPWSLICSSWAATTTQHVVLLLFLLLAQGARRSVQPAAWLIGETPPKFHPKPPRVVAVLLRLKDTLLAGLLVGKSGEA